MADFESKYSGEQVEEYLDQIANGDFATTTDINDAIANAITTTLNTAV